MKISLNSFMFYLTYEILHVERPIQCKSVMIQVFVFMTMSILYIFKYVSRATLKKFIGSMLLYFFLFLVTWQKFFDKATNYIDDCVYKVKYYHLFVIFIAIINIDYIYLYVLYVCYMWYPTFQKKIKSCYFRLMFLYSKVVPSRHHSK